MSLLKELTADRLAVRIYDTRAAMGEAAGILAAESLQTGTPLREMDVKAVLQAKRKA